MSMMKAIIIAIAVLLVLVFIIYHFNDSQRTAGSLAAGTGVHTLTYEGNKLFSSNQPIIASSDGVESFIYATPTGVMKFDTTTRLTTKVNSSGDFSSLAYDGNSYIGIKRNGYLFDLDKNVFKGSNYQKTYDTIGGYYISAIDSSTGNVEGGSTSGSIEPINGNYGLIELLIS